MFFFGDVTMLKVLGNVNGVPHPGADRSISLEHFYSDYCSFPPDWKCKGYPNDWNITATNGPDIYILNAFLMHSMWHLTPMRNVQAWWVGILKLIDADLARGWLPKYRFFFLSAPLVSEREPSVSIDRALAMNRLIMSDLPPRGFHMLDLGTIMLQTNYDKGSSYDDAMHPTPDVYRMLISMIGNVLCDSEAL
jgi:hypothetical protein